MVICRIRIRALLPLGSTIPVDCIYAREPETGPVYLEEKKEISELKGAVSSLTEKVKEVMERQEEASANKEQAAEGKRSYKIPTDLSVSS